MAMFEVKSLGGLNFVRVEKILALQTSPTRQTVIVMEGGVNVQSSETPAAIAQRLTAALAKE